MTKLKAIHSDTHSAKLAGTRGGTAEAQPPDAALFAALEAEADPSGDVT